MSELLSARQIAQVVGLSERRLQELAASGDIPSVAIGKQRRFLLDEVASVIEARPRPARSRATADLLRCVVCKLMLSRDQFPIITVRDKRCRPGHTWTGPAHECRECRKKQRRERRRRKAEEAGKSFVPRSDQAAYQAHMRAKREERAAERRARHERWLADQKEATEARRERLSTSPALDCLTCKRTLDRARFMSSEPRYCKECIAARDRVKFQRDKETLSDRYVKRQLTKHTGMAAHMIPPAMIEAKRVQLMLERALPIESERYAKWISTVLKDGPLDAERMNQMAASAGFSRSRLKDKDFRLARRNAATYDETTNTWRAR